MHYRGLLSLLILYQTVLSAEPMNVPHDTPTSRIAVSTRLVQLWSREQFKSTCGPEHANVWACTQFVGEDISTRCSADPEGRWSIDASVTVTAFMFVVDRVYISHEIGHVRDIERGLLEFVETAEARHYLSQEACEAASLTLKPGLRPYLKDTASTSSSIRH